MGNFSGMEHSHNICYYYSQYERCSHKTYILKACRFQDWFYRHSHFCISIIHILINKHYTYIMTSTSVVKLKLLQSTKLQAITTMLSEGGLMVGKMFRYSFCQVVIIAIQFNIDEGIKGKVNTVYIFFIYSYLNFLKTLFVYQ